MAAADRLSPRQRECLRLYWTRQATSKEIARELGIGKATVDGYIAEAVATLGARDRREAARLAFGEPPVGPGATPAGPEASPAGEEAMPPAPSGGDPARVAPAFDWGSVLPLRTGAHNDLSIAARFIWIFLLAVAAAVGFGAFASGVRVVSDLFR